MVKHPKHKLNARSHQRRHRKPLARGFTIIEVMIVLAIAGLIMLIVFIAVPKAQQSARDTGRKQAATLVAQQLNEYKLDHTLRYPSTAERCAFLKSYLTQYVSPSATCVDGGCTDGVLVHGNAYDFCFHVGESSPHEYLSDNADEISIQTGHWCNYPVGVTSKTGDPIQSSSNDLDLRYAVIWVPLERARLFCIDNH